MREFNFFGGKIYKCVFYMHLKTCLEGLYEDNVSLSVHK